MEKRGNDPPATTKVLSRRRHKAGSHPDRQAYRPARRKSGRCGDWIVESYPP